MATWTVNFYPYNVFELETATVSGYPDEGYPASRLYDRNISLYWKETGVGAHYFVASIPNWVAPVNFMAIHRSNFDLYNVSLQY